MTQSASFLAAFDNYVQKELLGEEGKMIYQLILLIQYIMLGEEINSEIPTPVERLNKNKLFGEGVNFRNFQVRFREASPKFKSNRLSQLGYLIDDVFSTGIPLKSGIINICAQKFLPSLPFWINPKSIFRIESSTSKSGNSIFYPSVYPLVFPNGEILIFFTVPWTRTFYLLATPQGHKGDFNVEEKIEKLVENEGMRYNW